MYKKEKGFTLIELLVVIAIIAMLSTVVMAGLNSARQKGRDAKRISDVKAVQTALDLYMDACGGYPMNIGAGSIPIGDATPGSEGLLTSTFDGTCTGSVAGGQDFGSFMVSLPTNPTPALAAQTTYDYCSTDTAGDCSNAANDGYKIIFGLEGDTGSLSAGVRTASPSGII